MSKYTGKIVVMLILLWACLRLASCIAEVITW